MGLGVLGARSAKAWSGSDDSWLRPGSDTTALLPASALQAMQMRPCKFCWDALEGGGCKAPREARLRWATKSHGAPLWGFYIQLHHGGLVWPALNEVSRSRRGEQGL